MSVNAVAGPPAGRVDAELLADGAFELFLLRADGREEEDVVGVIRGLVVDEHGAEAVLARPRPVLDEGAPEVLEQPARRFHVAGSVVQRQVAERPSGRHRAEATPIRTRPGRRVAAPGWRRR